MAWLLTELNGDGRLSRLRKLAAVLRWLGFQAQAGEGSVVRSMAADGAALERAAAELRTE